MAINSTTNLGLALPDQGEWDGTWGTNTNNQITTLIDSAVAGTTTLSVDADVTLTDTDFAANQSRQAILLWTASNGATTRNITAPARSKVYAVINAGTGSIVLRGVGPTTGITIVAGERCVAAWNGSDFVKVSTGDVQGPASSTNNALVAFDGTTGKLLKEAATVTAAQGGTGITSPGTAGNVLTSNGTAWTSQPPAAVSSTTGIGNDLSVTNYSLTLPTAVSSGSSGPRVQFVALSATEEMVLVHSDSALAASIWNSSTNSFSTFVLVRSANLSVINSVAAVALSSTSVLVCSLPSASTSLSTVVLTVSAGVITVNSAVNTTLAAASTLFSNRTRLTAVGSSYILGYQDTSNQPRLRAITVSGTTPTVGSQLSYSSGGQLSHMYAYDSSTLLLLTGLSTDIFAAPVAVSGTTLTLGTPATITTSNGNNFSSGVLSTGRVALAYPTSSTVVSCAVVSVSSAVASVSVASTTMSTGNAFPTMQVFGGQAFVLTGISASENMGVLTDTSGTASIGAAVVSVSQIRMVGFLSGNKVLCSSGVSPQNSSYSVFGINGSNGAVLEKSFPDLNVSSAIAQPMGLTNGGIYTQPLSGPPSSNDGTTTLTLRTSSGKTASMQSPSAPFVFSIDGTYLAKLQQTPSPSFGTNSISDALSGSTGWFAPSQGASGSTTLILQKVVLS